MIECRILCLCFLQIDAMAKLTQAGCTNPLRFGLAFYDFHLVTPYEIEFFNSREVQEQFLKLARILELFNKICA